MELSNVLYYSLYENSIYIYIIRQECGKYFIGKTNSPSITVSEITTLAKEHKQKWLLQYKPVNITEVIHSLDTWDEDKITLKYMDKYGIENVRGGSFNSVILSSEELFTIRVMISGAKGKCPICSALGHTKLNCPILTEFRDYEVVIKGQDDVLLTTADTDKSENNAAITKTEQTGYNQLSTAKDYMSSALLTVATTTSSIWQSWFGSASQKCLRCGYSGHKTANCQNDIKNCEDSLMFPDNKAYNPMFIGN
jgi:hypothetical protein